MSVLLSHSLSERFPSFEYLSCWPNKDKSLIILIIIEINLNLCTNIMWGIVRYVR